MGIVLAFLFQYGILTMWTIRRSDDYKKRAKKLSKRHCQGVAAVHANLDTFFEALKNGALVQDISFGFIHHEPDGVKAIDQKGASSSTELRLYVFPEPINQVLYLLTLGDKNTQSEDIKHCSEAVKYIKKVLI